jgi:hypothetical protein
VVCAAAFFVPNLWLSSVTKQRKLRLQRDLPNAMDLLVTCVEAGLGLDQALSRVAAELKLVAPILAAELNTTFLETQAGFSRRESFRRLSERAGGRPAPADRCLWLRRDLRHQHSAPAWSLDGMRIIRGMPRGRRRW